MWQKVAKFKGAEYFRKALYIKQADSQSVIVQLNIKISKTSDLSDFEHGMIVGAKCTGSSISETAALLGFSHTAVSRVYREWCDKQKTSSQRQSCGRKKLVDERGQRRMARMVQANKQVTNRQIMELYNSGNGTANSPPENG